MKEALTRYNSNGSSYKVTDNIFAFLTDYLFSKPLVSCSCSNSNYVLVTATSSMQHLGNSALLLCVAKYTTYGTWSSANTVIYLLLKLFITTGAELYLEYNYSFCVVYFK